MNFASVSGKKWIFKKYNDSEVKKISESYSLSEIVAKLLSIRKKNYWNFNSLAAKDPVATNLCSQLDLQKALEKSQRRIKREDKKIKNEKK